MKGQTNLATATALQLAMADFLANGGYDHHLRKMRRTLAARTEMVIDAVAEWFPQGTSMTQPQGGYVLWLELPEGIDTTDLYHKARREGVSIAPGVIFSCSNQFRNCLRLNTGYATGQALESLRRVAALIPS